MNRDETRLPHNVCLYDRERAELSGIDQVESFHESGILLRAPFGEISIEGEDLKIDQFSVETGKICITGKITGVLYYEKNRTLKGGLFSRRAK